MDSPTSGMTETSTTRIVARSSMMDSFRSCGLYGLRIDKEELKRKISMPQYLRVAIREAIRARDLSYAGYGDVNGGGGVQPPEAPMVVFVNSKSGGRHGPELKHRLQELMSEEQVFDLSSVRPHEFVEYGLGCLEKLAALGDICAKATREKLRIVVAGGDGTVGWVLGCLAELNKQGREPIPPTGIIPLGTGNDLSRSFGWGGSFPFAWKSAVKRSLHRAMTGPICRLDSWHVLISMPAGEKDIEPPYSLRPAEDCALDPGLELEEQQPEKVTCYEGVFYNYFSIGMDAQVAYGFHHLRNEKPYLAKGPISNKLIYSGYSCTQGWFCTPCISDPNLRGLKNILKIYIKEGKGSDWKHIPIPSSVRAIVALNLHSYGSGRHPWGKPRPGYLEERGFVEAHSDDGLLEIFGLKHGWHASFVMVELITAKHIAQAAAIRLEVRGGEWKQSYMQMDGEPWKQPLNKQFSTFVEIKRAVDWRVRMIVFIKEDDRKNILDFPKASKVVSVSN
ncbi:Diacylglycerol kinase, catalytic domain [Dillenia turbinata]|uniref:Diacylglycerol kinase n=1 Tax=Dillenia turbinata TaxID=194707 RepID=A0AAN8ZNH0_9MAGN